MAGATLADVKSVLAGLQKDRGQAPLDSRVSKRLSGCIIYTGPLTEKGYARVRVGGRKTYLHVVVYLALVGPIPHGFEVDHLCRVRSCMNPQHLEAVPGIVNLLRGEGACAKNARKTVCKRGHPFNATQGGGKWRKCNVCVMICRRNRRLRVVA